MPRTSPSAKSIQIGKRVRELRKQRGATQSEIGAAVGVERATITGIETGAAMPGRETMTALAKLFGVSLDYIESGTTAAGQLIPDNAANRPDEAAILVLWNLLSDAKKHQAIATLGEILRGPEPAETSTTSIVRHPAPLNRTK